MDVKMEYYSPLEKNEITKFVGKMDGFRTCDIKRGYMVSRRKKICISPSCVEIYMSYVYIIYTLHIYVHIYIHMCAYVNKCHVNAIKHAERRTGVGKSQGIKRGTRVMGDDIRLVF